MSEYAGGSPGIDQAACTHRATRRDKKAGYDACMFCVETGECDGKSGPCKRHAVTWDVWEDQEADARNSRF